MGRTMKITPSREPSIRLPLEEFVKQLTGAKYVFAMSHLMRTPETQKNR